MQSNQIVWERSGKNVRGMELYVYRFGQKVFVSGCLTSSEPKFGSSRSWFGLWGFREVQVSGKIIWRSVLQGLDFIYG